MNDEEKKAWEEFDTPEGFWKKMVEVANLPECKNDRRHEATRWAANELTLLQKELNNIVHDTGGHFCPDWDFMFIIPGSKEAEACTCNRPADDADEEG